MSTTTPTSPSSRALIALPIVPSPSSRSWSSSTTSSSSSVASTSSATLIEYRHHQEQREQQDEEQEQEQEQWQPILHASSNQVVLYNPRSHALSITSSSASPSVVVSRRHHRGRDHDTERWCRYCKQRLPAGFEMYEFGRSMTMNADDEHVVEGGGGERDEEENQDDDQERGRWDHGHHGGVGGGGVLYDDDGGDDEFESLSTDPAYHSRASDYFQLLAIANERSTGISGSSSSTTSHGAYRVGDTTTSSNSFVHANDEPLPSGSSSSGEGTTHNNVFPADKMAEGYFKTFFQEEYKLGMGANGSVFLCQHVLDGNPLGHFAVKKIAVGNSHSYLLKILTEVRLLERLHHPNIITYHHAWLESCQFSSFGPTVPTLHVLMQWAEGGSLDDFIDARLGRRAANVHNMHLHHLFDSAPNSAPTSSRASTTTTTISAPPDSPTLIATQTLMSDGETAAGAAPTITPTQQHTHLTSEQRDDVRQQSTPQDPLSRSARIRAFRAFQHATPEEKERMRGNWVGGAGGGGADGDNSGAAGGTRGGGEWTAVHLLSADEVKSLFKDVVEGLRFLHSKAILHLDLKPGNVLLTWDEGRLIPRAMLSDFGTSRDMLKRSRVRRSGNTGTLEYSAPESLPSPLTRILKETDSKADMWSLGMILHKLLFFKLPYRYAAIGDANGEPISRDEEFEKMGRLEKEVLDYPGFKSNPNLVSAFEARKLPRAFLVLLENLLNKTPSIRPSSERVATAIREGKLDPLEGDVIENLPLTRPWLDPDDGSSGGPLAHDKAKLLALPSPTDVLGPEEGSWSWTERYRRWIFQRRVGRRRWQHFGMRVLKSCLLVVKISSIPRLCPDARMRPRTVVSALLVGAAVVDSVLDEDRWEESAGLLLFHVGIFVWSGMWDWPCCCDV